MDNSSDRLLYEIEQFLIQNDASDYLHYFLKSMYPRIILGEIILIFAPIDAALQRLVDRSGKSLEEIANLPEGKDILMNFLSSGSVQLTSPVYTAVNGSYLPSIENLYKLNSIASIQLGNLYIETVNGVINMQGQLDRLRHANSMNISVPVKTNIIGDDIVTQFVDLPNPVVRFITLNLPPNDILNNCLTSNRLNAAICDSEDFWNEKLRKDFPKHQIMIKDSWRNTYKLLYSKLEIAGELVDYMINHDPNDGPPSVNSFISGISYMACGNEYGAIIINSKLYTFGNTQFDKLGMGGSPLATLHPDRIYLSATPVFDNSEQITGYNIANLPINNLDNVTVVSCGYKHTAVIDSNQLYMFGEGNSGQLGLGGVKNIDRPTLIPNLYGVTTVSCGPRHTAAVSNGQLYMFGTNDHGQLGLGDTVSRTSPTLVEELNDVTMVACGREFTAIIAGRRLYTVGRNTSGQAGHGNEHMIIIPRLVKELDNVTFVACGNIHMAVIADNLLYTFGNGVTGELGHGNKSSYSTPKLVKRLGNVTTVSCGNRHTACISDGQLYTFGSNESGQLVAGRNITISDKPYPVPGFNNCANVVCGSNSTMVLKY